MTTPVALEKLAGEIKNLYRSAPARSEVLIASYLEQQFQGISDGERLALLEKLAHHFKDGSLRTHRPTGLESSEVSRLFSLLLGHKISLGDLSSGELSEKFAHSLNTIFDSLNQIIGVINNTLLGKQPEMETIRHIIGSDLGGEAKPESLQNYLDQIQEAFLVAHQAFQQAARIKVSEILAELDPERISAQTDGGLKFGPLRKAELFDIYKEKFHSCKSWLESGRLTEGLLREFEKICQKLYNKKGGGAR